MNVAFTDQSYASCVYYVKGALVNAGDTHPPVETTTNITATNCLHKPLAFTDNACNNSEHEQHTTQNTGSYFFHTNAQ